MNLDPCVFIVDDDQAVRHSLGLLFQTAGLACESYESGEAFLREFRPERPSCLVLDLRMPGMSGLELQSELVQRNVHIPIVFLSAHGDIPTSVRAIQAGAVNFLVKPIHGKELLEQVRLALEQDARRRDGEDKQQSVKARFADLTARELEVMLLMIAGLSNKRIAIKLGISHRTVEAHRARLLEKTRAANLVELAHLAETAGIVNPAAPSV